MAEIVEVTPKKTPEIVEVTPERVSDPGKQALAGLSDIGTGIPAVLGLAGGGLQAGYNTLFDKGSFKENFAKAISDEGIDQFLLNAGLKGRSAVNEFLGIAEPISTEDQAARLAASLIPIPGLGVIGGASKLARVGRGVGNVLTPIVKAGPKGNRFNRGFGLRAGAQLGLGGAIDQGIRAVLDDPKHPLAFSKEALAGRLDPIDPAIGGAGQDELVGQASLDTLQEVEQLSLDPKITELTADGFEARRELDKKVQKNAEWEGVKTWLLIAGAAGGAYGGIKWAQRIAAKNAARSAPFGVDDTTEALPEAVTQGTFKYMGETLVDRSRALANSLKKMGHSQENIDHVVADSHIDPFGMAESVLNTGEFGQGFSRTTHALRDLEIEYESLGENKAIFDKAMVAQSERATRGRTGDANLWKATRTTDELEELIAAGEGNKKVLDLMEKFGDVFETHLDYQVFRKMIDPRKAQELKDQFARNGRLTYMPIYKAKGSDLLRGTARLLGFNTNQGKELQVMAEFMARSGDNIDTPIGPVDALRQYTIHSIEAANTNAYRMQALSALSGVDFTTGQLRRVFIDGKGGRNIVGEGAPPRPDHTGRGTTYVGKGAIDDIDELGNAKIQVTAGDPRGASRKFASGSLADIEKQAPDEFITVHHQGELHVFHVPDKGLRAAMELRPQLGAKLAFMNHYKNLFTRFTTGNLSLFAPISHAFSAQQVALATTAREGLGAGFKSIGQGLKASTSLAIDNTAKEAAQFLSYRLATNTGIGKIAPQASEQLRDIFERRFRDSMMNRVGRETGRLSSGLHANSFSGNVADFADSVGSNFAGKYGAKQMGLVWRMWKGWNTAIHEGPAYGAMLKKIGEARNAGQEITPRVMREAVDHSKTVAGDMRRLGGSDLAKAINASVPFSSAMIQSWNALGSAAKHDWQKFAMGAAAMIGAPTVMEMLYSATLGEEYREYYWNTFTTQQRADNMIIFIPGRPPEEAIIIPISPEWGLFRGAVMETMDAIFDFSQVGALKEAGTDQAKVSRNQLWAGIARVLDVPLPPLASAAFTAVGADVRFGLHMEESGDPDTPGAEVSLFRSIPLAKGERITRRSGQAKHAGSTIDTDIVNILQDVFGSAGALYVGVHEAFMAGKRDKLDGGISSGLENAASAFGNGLRKQARWTQPLFGKTLRPNANDEVATLLFNRREALKRLGNDFQSYFSGGQVDRQGIPSIGNQDVPPDDPINFELSGDAKTVLANVSLLDREISGIRGQISKMANATNLGSAREKEKLIDGKTLEIQALKARQLSSILDYEAHASEVLTKRYKRPVRINLGTFRPRPNLPTSSIGQELRKTPQTSQ
jgi:hypothetical protein